MSAAAGEATVLLPAPAWRDPRVHLLDDTWLVTIFAIALGTAIPWVVSDLQVNLAGVISGLVALAALHVALTALIDPGRAPTAWRARALVWIHGAGVVATGCIWHFAGGLQNPAFLLIFVMPVVGGIFLSRRLPYVTAVAAWVTVCIVALFEAPELRWYASGLGGADGWLATLFAGKAAAAPFTGLYAPSTYFVVMLEVFGVVLLGCAVAAEYLGTVFDRLQAQVMSARGEAQRGQELWAALIEHFPLPAMLVDADTLQVVCASEAVAPQFSVDERDPKGRALFEAIRFSYPEVIQELIAGAGGMARLSVIHAASQLRITDVRVQHMAQRGRRFAILVIEDRTEAFCVKAALDVSGHAALVLDANGRVLAYNKPVNMLFPRVRAGANATHLLAQPEGMGGSWWEPALATRRSAQVEIGKTLFQVKSTSLSLPGEEDRIHVVAFRPMARGEAPGGTTLTRTMVQPS